MNCRSFFPKFLQHIDQDVPREILTGHDVDFLSCCLNITGAAEFVRALEKRERVGQKPSALLCKRRYAPWPAALAIEFNAELGFQGYETVADPLLSNTQCVRRRADLAHARQLDKRVDLVGTEVR